jgi:hypothetical protein
VAVSSVCVGVLFEEDRTRRVALAEPFLTCVVRPREIFLLVRTLPHAKSRQRVLPACYGRETHPRAAPVENAAVPSQYPRGRRLTRRFSLLSRAPPRNVRYRTDSQQQGSMVRSSSSKGWGRNAENQTLRDVDCDLRRHPVAGRLLAVVALKNRARRYSSADSTATRFASLPS